MPTLLGAHSPRLAAVHALLSTRGRREQGRFTIEGPTLLAEALTASVALDAVYATEQALERESVLRSVDDGRLFVVAERAMRRLSDLQTPPGIVAVARAALTPLASALAMPGAILALAALNDPGNAGTLLRSAEIFGVGAVVFGDAGVEPHHPKVVRAAMGALFRLPIARATPAELADATRAVGRALVFADPRGASIVDVAFPERPVFVIGNERHGVSGWLTGGDHRVRIPQRGEGESLNAAVAGSIILYEWARRNL